MSFCSKFEYFSGRAAMSRTASSAALDPAIAYAHRELAVRYEAVCDSILKEKDDRKPGRSAASPTESLA